MRGLAESILSLIWRSLPALTRERLSRKMLEAQARAAKELPRSNTLVYSFTSASASQFSQYLPPSFPNGTVCPKEDFPEYSLVMTCRNEAQTIRELLNSVLSQTLLPRQIVICDGGSTDGTVEEIRKWEDEVLAGSAKSGKSVSAQAALISLTLIEAGDVSIAAGRNIAVASAACELLAFTDAGGTLDRVWAERILSPFAHNEETELSMGWYRPVVEGTFQKAASHFVVPRLSAVDPLTFLPSGRSLALKKEVFNRVGGFPEYLSFAGEDSLFDYNLKTAISHVAFVPDALVYWRFPQGLPRLFKTLFNYARGDAEGGVLFWDYYLRLLNACMKIGVELGVFVLFVLLACLFGGGWFFLSLCVVSMLLVAVRCLRLLVSYSPFAKDRLSLLDRMARLAALSTMITAQATGFLKGLRFRPFVERKRMEQAEKGNLVLFLPRFHVFDKTSETTQSILKHLKEKWFLTLVYAQTTKVPSPENPSFEHPRLENYLRPAFDVDVWLDAHREVFNQAGRSFCYLDLCNDAWTRDLAAKLSYYGAVPLEG